MEIPSDTVEDHLQCSRYAVDKTIGETIDQYQEEAGVQEVEDESFWAFDDVPPCTVALQLR